MAVFGVPAATRAAMVWSRAQDNQNVLRWTQKDLATGVEMPVDLSGYTITVTLMSPHGDVWLAYPAAKDLGGFLHVGPSRAQLAGVEWGGRALGRYTVVAIKNGLATCLADDDFRII